MKKLLLLLADWLVVEPLVADETGCYQVLIADRNLTLVPMGAQLVIRSVLQGKLEFDNFQGGVTLQRALEMVTSWGRQLPHALVISPQGQWMIEARLERNNLDFSELQRVLIAHVAILDSIQPLFTPGSTTLQKSSSIWRP